MLETILAKLSKQRSHIAYGLVSNDNQRMERIQRVLLYFMY